MTFIFGAHNRHSANPSLCAPVYFSTTPSPTILHVSTTYHVVRRCCNRHCHCRDHQHRTVHHRCRCPSEYECETDTIRDSLEKMQTALKTHLDNFYNNTPGLKEQFGLDNSLEDNAYIMLERMKLCQLHANSFSDLNGATITDVKLLKRVGLI